MPPNCQIYLEFNILHNSFFQRAGQRENSTVFNKQKNGRLKLTWIILNAISRCSSCNSLTSLYNKTKSELISLSTYWDRIRRDTMLYVPIHWLHFIHFSRYLTIKKHGFLVDSIPNQCSQGSNSLNSGVPQTYEVLIITQKGSC